MPKITTFLAYRSGAEEAARLYVSLFPDSRIGEITRYGAAGPGEPGSVMTVAFELAGRDYVALNGGPHFEFTDAVSLAVECDNQEEIDHYWEGLSRGGEEGPCGWLRDRFGLWWQVNPRILVERLSDADPERSARVMAVLLGMKKIVIADLEAAYEGRTGAQPREDSS